MKNINSLLIHGGGCVDEATGAVNYPIYQTSTFEQIELGKHRGYEYSRTANPTRAAAERLVAQLEDADFRGASNAALADEAGCKAGALCAKNAAFGEARGFAFASGMAATTTALAMFNAGDEIVISSNVYGGTFRVIDKVFSRFNLKYTICDMRDEELLRNTLEGTKAKALFLETPANPLMSVTDIAKTAAIAHEFGAILIVDNTFMTPYLQRPLSFGADIVIHSATKYLGGHSDLVAGFVVAKDPQLCEKIAFLQNSIGAVLAPFDSFLLIRGVKTLGVRMDRHCQNAQEIAKFLASHEAVKEVFYPLLGAQAVTHAKQAHGGGGMISFELNEGWDFRRFVSGCELIALAESLGGVESLLCHPASMTHASIPPQIRAQMGISDNLVRLSVGIESGEDLVADIDSSLQKAKL